MRFVRWLLMLALGGLAGVWLLAGVLRLGTAYLEKRYPPPVPLTVTKDGAFLLMCEGSGPVVILESGLGLGWDSWHLVYPKVSKFARVCVYDRAGYGWSGPASGQRTADQLADELKTLLQVSGEKPPYLLVGHSFGGVIAHAFAARHGASLTGLVLVETSEGSTPAPFVDRSISKILPFPLGTFRFRVLLDGVGGLSGRLRNAPKPFQHRAIFSSPIAQLRVEEGELTAMKESEHQVSAAAVPASLPVRIVIAGGPEIAGISIARQYALTTKLPSAVPVVANKSGHLVQLDEPELIVDLISYLAKIGQK